MDCKKTIKCTLEESRQCLAGFSWAKEYVLIYMESERTEIYLFS